MKVMIGISGGRTRFRVGEISGKGEKFRDPEKLEAGVSVTLLLEVVIRAVEDKLSLSL